MLQATLDELAGEFAIGIIEGDIATDLDAAKLSGRGAQVSLLNTSNGFGGECHLDAPMVNRALPGLDLPGLDLVIIENVGNLVCPAEFDVGEHAKAMVYSVTEGEDKPLKYPVMFRSVDVVLLNKIDLVPYLDADVEAYIAHVRQVNTTAAILPVSARTGAGMAAWFGWLRRFARGAPWRGWPNALTNRQLQTIRNDQAPSRIANSVLALTVKNKDRLCNSRRPNAESVATCEPLTRHNDTE
ncbi:hypothetical protein NIIDMKKI_48360 [Mycobacterium kansasii]|uniref:CobW/HypB/UreG nucleotide-binding domain-containing protein n=1 Tax=Mycobacterium kansasii TaxID=1768 RepID=A0A7G1IFN1_MYCKA|nr:hypothetical protein NIIDMKKI_48360 [Mycobacterium kansasii]